MMMIHTEDLRQIHVVDRCVHTVDSQVNRISVVDNKPIDLPKDHHHRESIPNVVYNHLSNNHRIVFRIEYMFCSVEHPFVDSMRLEHHQPVNAIEIIPVNNHRLDQKVVLEQEHVLLE
mgnify:FL=1